MKIEKFAKVEDLLNNYSEAAIIPERLIPYFADKYKVNVILYKLSDARINIGVLTITEPPSSRIVRLNVIIVSPLLIPAWNS